MPLKTASQSSKSSKLFYRKISAAGKDAVKQRRFMSAREKEHIIPFSTAVPIFGRVFHLAEKQGGNNICAGKASSRMSALSTGNHPYYIPSDLCSGIFKLLYIRHFINLFC